MAPLIIHSKQSGFFDVKVCITGQHKTMLDQVLTFFEIVPDFDLSLMKEDQTLFDISSKALKGIEKVYSDYHPDLTLVQGDTTTAFIGALSSFYKKVKVAHVEAGLRSGNKFSPYPEEINRKLVAVLTDLHFAPTKKAATNLAIENIKENVFVVGNTVIDALLWGLKKISTDKSIQKRFNYLDPKKKLILVTGHRRESFGKPFEQICEAIVSIARKNPDIQLIYPVHLNPNVQRPVKKVLSDQVNIFLIDPIDYPDMIWLMNKSYFVLTDSGGIQEEAPSLGKPVLVMRNVTERTEGVEAGTAILVGTDKEKIIEISQKLLDNKLFYSKIANAINPYGDGTSSKQIILILKKLL